MNEEMLESMKMEFAYDEEEMEERMRNQDGEIFEEKIAEEESLLLDPDLSFGHPQPFEQKELLSQ
jgi:hypothetical protein